MAFTITNGSRRAAPAAGLASALASAALLSGCSFHAEAGKAAVSKEKLASYVQQRLDETTGTKAKGVSCDGDLPAKVGATQHCTLTKLDDKKLPLTITTTAVDGTDVKFDIEPDKQVTG